MPNTATNKLSAKHTSPLKLFAHLASKVPLIVSDIPSLRNVVTNEHVTFFTADNPEDLVKQIHSVLAEQGSAHEKAMRAYELSKQFTWKQRAMEIIRFVT